MIVPACIGLVPRPVVAPDPSSVVRTIREDRDWLAAANIETPEQFRVWEGVLREITGEAPVPADRIHLVTNKMLRRICSPDAGGCYRSVKRDIWIGDTWEEGIEEGSYSRSGHCKMQRRSTLKFGSRVEIWAHEQDHHSDRFLGNRSRDRWVNEIEAELLVFYFGEHIARNYDQRLGLSLIHNMIVRCSIREESLSELLAMSAGDFGAHIATSLGDLSIMALLGSGRFHSFGELWYYVHTHTHDEIEMNVRRNTSNVERGFEIAENLTRQLISVEIQVPDHFDDHVFREFRLGNGTLPRPNYPDPNYHDPNEVDAICWLNGDYAISFLRIEDEETGVISWRLKVRDIERMPFGTSLFTIWVIKRTDGTTGIELLGPDNLDETQTLVISDITRERDLANLTIGTNPADLPFCITESNRFSMNPREYWRLVRGIFEQVRGNLAHIANTPEDARREQATEMLGYFERQMEIIFRE
jgi:hypothetical protein